MASLDPLSADEVMRQLPEWNRQRDTIALVLALVDLLPSMRTAESFDFSQANAAMRDIGMFLGSLKRHAVEPVNVIPELEEKLNLLADKTHLPPRDTLIHYTIWNPDGERIRSYTGTADEAHLIQSVKVAMHPLFTAIYQLKDLYDTPLSSPDFSFLSERIAENFEAMVTGIVHAKRNVSPQYFAQELRFYFDPITLNDREYLGPGAVEMPVFVFDHILWGCDCPDSVYTTFKNSYVPYVQAAMRDVYNTFTGCPSLIRKVCAELLAARRYDARIHASAKSLLKIHQLMKSFRMPHKKLAEAAYDHGNPGEHRTQGSGGYAPDILDHLIRLTAERFQELDECIRVYTARNPAAR